MQWWATSARSAGVGLAVPMSMPRYTCIESTDTISTPVHGAGEASASADLPDAVGPTMASGGDVTAPSTGMRVRVGGQRDDLDELAR